MKKIEFGAAKVVSGIALGAVVTRNAFASNICLGSEAECFPDSDLSFLRGISAAVATNIEYIGPIAGAGLAVFGLHWLKKASLPTLPTIALFAIVGLGLAFAPHALAQIDTGGGKSMMGELGFIKDLGATGTDVLVFVAKIIGAIFVVGGVKSVGQRQWEYAIPQLACGVSLFFIPQIVAAFQKMSGGG